MAWAITHPTKVASNRPLTVLIDISQARWHDTARLVIGGVERKLRHDTNDRSPSVARFARADTEPLQACSLAQGPIRNGRCGHWFPSRLVACSLATGCTGIPSSTRGASSVPLRTPAQRQKSPGQTYQPTPTRPVTSVAPAQRTRTVSVKARHSVTASSARSPHTSTTSSRTGIGATARSYGRTD